MYTVSENPLSALSATVQESVPGVFMWHPPYGGPQAVEVVDKEPLRTEEGGVHSSPYGERLCYTGDSDLSGKLNQWRCRALAREYNAVHGNCRDTPGCHVSPEEPEVPAEPKRKSALEG